MKTLKEHNKEQRERIAAANSVGVACDDCGVELKVYCLNYSFNGPNGLVVICPKCSKKDEML